MDSPVTDREFFRRLFSVCWRFKYRAALCVMAILTGVVLLVAFTEREYRSQAILFLRVGRESVTLDATATTGQTVGINESRAMEIESARQLVESRAMHERVVDKLGPDFILNPPVDPDEASQNAGGLDLSSFFGKCYDALASMNLADPVGSREKAIIEMSSNLSSGVRDETSVIEINYDSPSPEHAQTILTAVMNEFIADHQRAHSTSGSLTFFEEAFDDSQNRLEDATQRLSTLKNESNLLSIEGRRDALQSQMNSVDLERLTAESELVSTQKRIKAIEAQLAQLPEEVVLEKNEGLQNDAADQMRQTLYELEIQQKNLLSKFTPEHPVVIALAIEVEEAREILESQEKPRDNWKTGLNPLRQPFEVQLREQQSQLAALEGKIAQLQEQKAGLLTAAHELNEREVQIKQLEREVGTLEGEYAANSDSLEQARIEFGLDEKKISNVNIMQEPSLAEKPIRPRKAVMLLLGIVASMLGACTVVYFSYVYDKQPEITVESQGNVEHRTVRGIPIRTPVNGDSDHAAVNGDSDRIPVNGETERTPVAASNGA